MGRSLDLQPLNPLDFHISQIWRHRIRHGYHSNVAPCGPSDDHTSPASASPEAWRAWARSVRDLRPAWAAARTDASTDIRDAADPRDDATADIDTAIITAARLRDLDTVLRLCASAIRGIPPAILIRRDVTAVRRAIVGASSLLRRRRAGSQCPALSTAVLFWTRSCFGPLF